MFPYGNLDSLGHIETFRYFSDSQKFCIFSVWAQLENKLLNLLKTILEQVHGRQMPKVKSLGVAFNKFVTVWASRRALPPNLAAVRARQLWSADSICFPGAGEDDKTFLSTTIFSKEAIFLTDSRANCQNVRIWSKMNPEVIRKSAQWETCRVVHSNSLRVYGSFFFEMVRIIGRCPGIFSCHNFRERTLLTSTDSNMKEQHFANCAREFLNEHFCGWWIARRGAEEWPLRASDLAGLVLWWRGHITQLCIASTSTNVEHLKKRISSRVFVWAKRQLLTWMMQRCRRRRWFSRWRYLWKLKQLAKSALLSFMQ